jgi:hypothetical protein
VVSRTGKLTVSVQLLLSLLEIDFRAFEFRKHCDKRNNKKRHYMSDEPKPKQPWFGPKRIGYGYSPRAWQGWLLVIVVAIIVILVTRFLIR